MTSEEEDGGISASALFKNIRDFVSRYRNFPETDDPKSLEVISDFFLCANTEGEPRIKPTDAEIVEVMAMAITLEDADCFPTLNLKQDKYVKRLAKAALQALRENRMI